MNTMHKKGCPDPEELMAVLIDNRGTEDEVRFMRAHIEHCHRCALLMRDMEKTRNVLSEIPREKIYLSPHFTSAVMESIGESVLSRILDDIFDISKKVVTAGAFLVVLLIGIMLFSGDGSVDFPLFDELTVTNGIESEMLQKDELSQEDIIMMAFSRR